MNYLVDILCGFMESLIGEKYEKKTIFALN